MLRYMNKRCFFRMAVLSAVILLVFSIHALAANSKAGTSAFSFLKINIGARSCAMGGAFTGLADDISTLYYNPAGIGFMEGKSYIFEYHNYFEDLQSGFAGYVRPIMKDKMLGISIDYLNYGEFVKTDKSGNNIGTFGGSDLVLSGTLAGKINEQYAVGGTLKFIYEKLESFSATGAAVDLGFKYSSDRARYTAGFAIQNLGFQFSGLGNEKQKLPLTFRLGGSAYPRGLPFRLSSDLILPVDNDIDIAVGGEYLKAKPLYIRIGWNSFGSNFRAEGSNDKWAGFSLGFGFDIKKMQLSYSYSPGADLGESHRITLVGGL
jgi:hypothetical protein